MGVRWAVPRDGPQPVWTPEGGSATVTLRFTYSLEGSHHIELVEGPPGSIWHGGDAPGAHHVGVWVDDVAGEVGHLTGDGWALVAAQKRPEEGFGMFAYLAPPNGMVLELVDGRVRPHFEAWWNEVDDIID